MYDTVDIAYTLAIQGNYVYIADGSDGLRICGKVKPYNELFYHESEQKVGSNLILSVEQRFSAARFLINNKNNNQFLQIEMSCDNGITWQLVNDTVYTTLPGLNNNLRWRARMRTFNRYESPVVKKICIEYWEK